MSFSITGLNQIKSNTSDHGDAERLYAISSYTFHFLRTRALLVLLHGDGRHDHLGEVKNHVGRGGSKHSHDSGLHSSKLQIIIIHFNYLILVHFCGDSQTRHSLAEKIDLVELGKRLRLQLLHRLKAASHLPRK